MERNMRTIIRVDENNNVIERKIENEKPMPDRILDLIAPIIRKGIRDKRERSRC